MSDSRTCARCAALLPDAAPEGAVCDDCIAAIEAAQTMAAPGNGSPSVSYQLPPERSRAEVIGDFEIIDKLGQGGMGAVYRARQVSLHRIVALKVLPQYFAADEENVGRFQREARIAAGLVHANIVHVFSSGVVDGTHYIAMELVEGENLRQRTKRERLSIPEALHICAEVARGLQYGWEKAHLVHRDIKPGNIFLSTDGAVKVGDLGLAKSLSGVTSGLTQTGTSLGTALYMSPEQVRGDKTFDFRSDIYSLGCTLYEMLTGHPPYTGADGMSVMRMHLDAPLPAILRALPGCPMPLARLVGKMLKKNPRERHASYAALIAEIEAVREQIDAGVANTGPSRIVEAWKQVGDLEAAPAAQFGLLWAGLTILLLSGGGIAWWMLQPAKPQKAATPHASFSSPKKIAADPISPIPNVGSGASALHSPTAPQWRKIKLTTDQLGPSAALGSEGEWIIKGKLALPGITARNLVVRYEIQRTLDSTLAAYVRRTGDTYRQLGYGPTGASLQYHPDATNIRTHGVIPLSTPDDGLANWVPIVIASVGVRTLGSVYGKAISKGDVPEHDAPGEAGFLGNGKVRNLEVLLLDGLPDDEALKLATAALAAPVASTVPADRSATTTKDAPFVNSLGMKFVPVPITGGPTGGKRVLFSVWETRVQDYEVFVKETGLRWTDPHVESGPTHPAVNVNWDMANAFCTWLTERERTAGKLGANEGYRLPSDHEWSCAAGIGGREDPAQFPTKKGNIAGVFPWGSAWPVPSDAANINGEERAGVRATGDTAFLQGHRDPFITTAPVGSFTPSAEGLFDLAGNAREWCEDLCEPGDERRLTRGGSYMEYADHALFASARYPTLPNTVSGTNGFRIVLAPAEGAK